MIGRRAIAGFPSVPPDATIDKKQEQDETGEGDMAGAAQEVDFSRYRRIKANRQDRVLTLALSNPGLMNDVDGDMHRELSQVFLEKRAPRFTGR